ncbi:MAG: tRNA (cytosine(32)/uridine(32)-2'-O)-methyltransferase TrmJ [Pseudomonadales bacterium]|uniref:tRNA (cytosine(32)/uridine(32)-2'-O)-methyltransferase TrmJ n=1 Tax=Halopseudomonas aestusnigri TaxID=857252 RepID=UPI000C40500B|nr:tRNA (cytosine(32)/uridine(32)-2'-O)-methyltransferase TrmJ [Halopseudomonas aestusnigri]MBP77092.1 tRNA (cytosine(32)/uridine(32)-2'-O)-methyltransferase TrmJ [Pseudomonadales bacterium]MDL2198554.1 tRNA (cytosine(32)/uridine(32)-2'-O)-methyltransferase TrmJ [Halopseudomonas aestusnigri]MEE2798786.1 tRNA (cytosine(32)/uridine(32)-2'-O)-methyltransferase TrmJ [Pseudomonadota bacterium]
MLKNVRVVLVNTSHPGNIGGAARAMKNMGLSELVLVDPERFPDPDAVSRASGADDVLANARIVATLEEAIADCSLVLGTSARDRRIPWPVLDPRESADKVLDQLEQLPDAQIALVFGREDSGLTTDELQRCQYHVHIPSMPDFSSLNLAAAVQVLAYELRMQGLQREGAPTKMHKVETTAVFNEIPATAGELEQFYQHLEQVLVEIGFHDPQKPRQLMPRLRRLYGRVHLNRMEMNILRGILTETQKAVGVKAAGERRT